MSLNPKNSFKLKEFMPDISKETLSALQRHIIKPGRNKIRTGNFALVGAMDECCSTFLLSYIWNSSIPKDIIFTWKAKGKVCVCVHIDKIPEYLQAL